MIEAFIDESGTHKGSPIVSVAAVMGAHWQWRRLLSYWGNQHFHAKDPKCAPLKYGLFDAMQDSGLESFVAWITPDDYQAYTTPHFRTALGNAYAVCTFAAAMGVCKHCRENNLGKIAFVVEDGQPNIGFVKGVLEFMQSKEPYGITSVAVAKKKEFVQLCTADFVAHSRSSDEEWYERLYDSGRVSQDRITSAKLGRMSEQISQNINRWKQQKRVAKKSAKSGADT